MRALLLLAIALSIGLASAADSVVPDSTVTLSLEEYRSLFTEARLAAAGAELKEKQRALEQEYKERNSMLNERRDQLESGLFPSNYQMLESNVNGTFNVSASLSFIDADVATFAVVSTLRILSDRWTIVPLANSSSIVASDWRLEWRPDAFDTLTDTNGTASAPPWTRVDVVSEPRALLLLRGEGHAQQHVLATNRSGLYRVSFAAHARVRRARHLKELSLSLLYPVAQVSLRLVGVGTINELAMTPAAAVVHQQPAEADPATTELHATMPPATAVAFKWHDATPHAAPRARPPQQAEWSPGGEARPTGSGAPEAPAQRPADPEPPARPQVTASHDALVSINEGLVQTTHALVLKSSADSSPLAAVEVLIWDNATRVTGVVASGLEAWHVAPVTAAELRNGSASEVVASRLRASFRSSHLEPSTTLMLSTELEVEMARGDFGLPVVECQGVLRQTGRIGLATVASVQVETRRAVGLASADPAELASQLRLNTDRPIVMAYKYLAPRHELRVGVTQHEQLGVLEAAVDRMHYAAAVVDTHVMHAVELTLQHTQQQYLALHGLPPSAHMFSLSVDGEPVKPVAGGAAGVLLVPLLGAGRRDDDDGYERPPLHISLAYLSRHELDAPRPERDGERALRGDARNGSFSLPLPSLALPVSVLTAELRLPQSHEYNFSSALDEVDELEYDIPRALSDPRPKRAAEEGERVLRKRGARSVQRTKDDAKDAPRGSGGARSKGKRPSAENGPQGVRVNLPSGVGRLYWFQRLLVVDASLRIDVTYFEPVVEDPVVEPLQKPPPPRWRWKLW